MAELLIGDAVRRLRDEYGIIISEHTIRRDANKGVVQAGRLSNGMRIFDTEELRKYAEFVKTNKNLYKE